MTLMSCCQYCDGCDVVCRSDKLRWSGAHGQIVLTANLLSGLFRVELDRPVSEGAKSSLELGNQEEALMESFDRKLSPPLQVQVVHAASRAREADIEDSAKGKCIGSLSLQAAFHHQADVLTSPRVWVRTLLLQGSM